jgi:hypothetical protein
MKICLLILKLTLGVILATKTTSKTAENDQAIPSYTIEEYRTYFSDKFEKYLPDRILSLRYEQDKGFHLVANRQIKIGEPVIEVPCNYVIGVCKFHQTINGL